MYFLIYIYIFLTVEHHEKPLSAGCYPGEGVDQHNNLAQRLLEDLHKFQKSGKCSHWDFTEVHPLCTKPEYKSLGSEKNKGHQRIIAYTNGNLFWTNAELPEMNDHTSPSHGVMNKKLSQLKLRSGFHPPLWSAVIVIPESGASFVLGQGLWPFTYMQWWEQRKGRSNREINRYASWVRDLLWQALTKRTSSRPVLTNILTPSMSRIPKVIRSPVRIRSW